MTTLTLRDGLLDINPFPDGLKNELKYWKRVMQYNPKTHKRDVVGHYEYMWWENEDGSAHVLSGHTHRVLEWLRSHNIEFEFADKRTPMPEPRFVRAAEGLRPYQRDMVLRMLAAKGGVLRAATGLGKAIPNNTLIPTPGGFMSVGDIKVGDELFGKNGCPVKVVAVYPQSDKKQVYEIEFSDKRVVECCKDHLWQWTDHYKRPYKVSSTVDLMNELKVNHTRVRIPVCDPVEYTHKELPVDPYVLGVLLGNGCLREDALTVSSGNSFVPEKVAKILGCTTKRRDYNYSYQFWWNNPIREYNRRIVKKAHTCDVLTGCCSGLAKETSGNKYIPVDYLTASVEQRMQLLRGLMDTDGGVGNKARISYSTTSLQLAKDIVELARSLGMVARIGEEKRNNKYRSGHGYYVTIRCRPEIKPYIVTLPDKLEKIKEGLSIVSHHEHNDEIRVVDIRETSRFEDMTCFTVDSPDGLFLCNDYTVTHNTFCVAKMIDAWDPEELKIRGTPVSVFACPDKDITRKNYEELTRILPHREVGLVMSGVKKFSDDIQVITLDSLHLLDPSQVGILVVDEVHTAASDSRAEELLKFNKAVMYGVSATPSGRFDGKDLVTEGIFGPVVVSKDYKDGVEAGALVPIEVIWINSPEPTVGLTRYRNYKTRDGKIGAGMIGNWKANQMISNILKEIPEDMQCLVITQFIEQMDNILRFCDEDVKYVHAQTSDDKLTKYQKVKAISPNERKEIYTKVYNKEIKKIISSFVFKQGVNFPDLNIVINAAGGGSDIASAQIPGRASRKTDGKEVAYMIDFWHPWDIDGGRWGPLLANDKQRRKVYNELGFKQKWIDNLSMLSFKPKLS